MFEVFEPSWASSASAAASYRGLGLGLVSPLGLAMEVGVSVAIRASHSDRSVGGRGIVGGSSGANYLSRVFVLRVVPNPNPNPDPYP